MTDSGIFKNLQFKQTENSCQIAALGVAHYYFSKIQHANPDYLQDTVHFGDLFKSYLNYIESSLDLSSEERHKYFSAPSDYRDLTDNVELEKRVHETYLGFCKDKELRGSEHIAHFSDCLSCQENAPKIKANACQGKDVKIEDIFNELQKRDSLIAVLINGQNHWIVLGCDRKGEGLYAVNTSQGSPLVQRKTKNEIEQMGITEYIKYSPGK